MGAARDHGTDGNGGELGPAIAARAVLRTDEELEDGAAHRVSRCRYAAVLHIADAEAADLWPSSARCNRGQRRPPSRLPFTLADGRTRWPRAQSNARRRTAAGGDTALHLLRAERQPVSTSDLAGDWPSYNGGPDGSRYSTLAQIDRSNVERLAPKWMFTVAERPRLQVTPVVVGGVMYVTSANECWALDAGSGREIWHYQRPRTEGL